MARHRSRTVSKLREQVEAAISSTFDHHSTVHIHWDNVVHECECGVITDDMGWHQIQMAVEAVLQIIEPQEASTT